MKFYCFLILIFSSAQAIPTIGKFAKIVSRVPDSQTRLATHFPRPMSPQPRTVVSILHQPPNPPVDDLLNKDLMHATFNKLVMASRSKTGRGKATIEETNQIWKDNLAKKRVNFDGIP